MCCARQLLQPHAQTGVTDTGTPQVISGQASQNRQYHKKPLSDPSRPKVKERHEIPLQLRGRKPAEGTASEKSAVSLFVRWLLVRQGWQFAFLHAEKGQLSGLLPLAVMCLTKPRRTELVQVLAAGLGTRGCLPDGAGHAEACWQPATCLHHTASPGPAPALGLSGRWPSGWVSGQGRRRGVLAQAQKEAGS